jgi:NADP-dependent 3-hydroxy acid dehydrogenase YdfG
MMGQAELREKLAAITGASSGIGRAIALELAGHGVRLCLLGRDEARLREVARETGGSIHAFDLTDDEAVRSFARELLEPDILVHSAGVVALAPVAEAPLEDLDRQYRLNLRAPYALTQSLLPALVERRGQIVFINSGSGLKANAGWSQYAASKHGLKALADSLREEVGRSVRVISVYPGRTASPMQEEVHRLEGKPYDAARFVQPQEVAGVVVHALAMPRTAVVADVSVRPA